MYIKTYHKYQIPKRNRELYSYTVIHTGSCNNVYQQSHTISISSKASHPNATIATCSLQDGQATKPCSAAWDEFLAETAMAPEGAC